MKLQDILEVSTPLSNQIERMPHDQQIELNFANASATVERKGDHLVLHFIKSTQKGGGSKALEEICQAADYLKLPIELHVHPIKSHAAKAGIKPLSKKDLRAWYVRYGFEGEFDSMRREPN